MYRLQWLCTTEEHFWTLDNATLTWFRTLYPWIQRGHWRYFGAPSWSTTTWTNRRRRRKHRGRRAGIRNRLRKRALSPPLPSILLANVQSLENKMDDLRARISFQRDIRDCNIFCLTETWLTPSVPDTTVTPSDNFSVYGWTDQPRPEKTKVVECFFFINKKWVWPQEYLHSVAFLFASSGASLHYLPPLLSAPGIYIDPRVCRLYSSTSRH